MNDSYYMSEKMFTSISQQFSPEGARKVAKTIVKSFEEMSLTAVEKGMLKCAREWAKTRFSKGGCEI